MIDEVKDLAAKEATAGLPRTEIHKIVNRLEGGQEARRAAVGMDEGRFITGDSMMDMRSVMSADMRDAFKGGNSQLGKLYGEVLEKYDEAIEKAVTQMARKSGGNADETIAMYSQARDRWNVWRALDRGGATTDGHVMVHAAANNIKNGDKSGYLGRVGSDGETMFRKGSGNIGQNPTGDL